MVDDQKYRRLFKKDSHLAGNGCLISYCECMTPIKTEYTSENLNVATWKHTASPPHYNWLPSNIFNCKRKI